MANSKDIIGPAKTGIGAGLKLGQLSGLIGKGFQVGGSTIPYAGALALPAWLATSIMTGNDYTDENYAPRSAMQGAGALMAMTPAWPLGIAMGLGSLLIPNQPPDPPRLFLSGGETVKWGDTGLSGYEGLLWDTYSNKPISSTSPWQRGEEYIKAKLADPTNPIWDPESGAGGASFVDRDKTVERIYQQRLAEYNDAKNQGILGISLPNFFPEIKFPESATPYDWGVSDPLYGTRDLDPEGWMDKLPTGDIRTVTGRGDPIKSAKWGDIYSEPDLLSQGAPWMSMTTGHSEEFIKKYPQFRESVNTLTQGHISTFNENVMEYLDTLPEAQRSEMMGKLQNADFRIDFVDPSSKKNLYSGAFMEGSPDVYRDFMKNVSGSVSKQLMDQAVKIGIPRSAFMGSPNSEDSTMPKNTEQLDSTGWELANTSSLGYAPGYPSQDSYGYAPGQPSTGPANQQQQLINQYIDGYDWNDYWNRLENRAGGLGDLYGSMSDRLEDVLQARQDSFQQTDPMYLGLTSDTLADYNALKDEYASLKQSSPDIGVSLGGQSMLNMGQRLNSKRNLLENIARQTTLRQSALEGLTGSRDSFLGGWKSDLGDITSMYQAGLNAPLTSYQEMAPNVSRWEGYGEAGVQRDWLAQQAALDRENQRALANIASERGGDSWASILAAIGAGGGGIAKLLGMDTGGGNNLLGSIGGGLKGIGGGIGDLFGGGGWDDYSWADGLTDDDIAALMGDIGSSGFEDWGSWNFDDLWY